MFINLYFIEEPLKIVKPLQEVVVMENQPSVLVCELNKPDVQVQWTKNGLPVVPNDNLSVSNVGGIHTLTIQATKLEDEAEYALSVGDLKTQADLLVEGKHTELLSSGFHLQTHVGD